MAKRKSGKNKKLKIRVIKEIIPKISEIKKSGNDSVDESLTIGSDKQQIFSDSSSFSSSSSSKPRLLSNISLEGTASSGDIGSVIPTTSNNSSKVDTSLDNIKNYVEKAANYSSVRVISDKQSDSRQSRIVERPVHVGPDMGTPARVERVSVAPSPQTFRELDNLSRFNVSKNIPFEPAFVADEPYINDIYVPKYTQGPSDNGLGEAFQKDFFMRRRRKDL